MPETHDHGHLYWHWQHYRKQHGFLAWAAYLSRKRPRPIPKKYSYSRPPLLDKARTFEVEEPYRAGKGYAVRCWPSRWAIVIGWWGKPAAKEFSEKQLLERAIVGSMMPIKALPTAQWRRTPNRRWLVWSVIRRVQNWVKGLWDGSEEEDVAA
jgi:hypothetical protein